MEMTSRPSMSLDDCICKWECLLACLLLFDTPLLKGIEISRTDLGTRLFRVDVKGFLYFIFFRGLQQCAIHFCHIV